MGALTVFVICLISVLSLQVESFEEGKPKAKKAAAKGCKAPTHKAGKFSCKGQKSQSCKSKKCKVAVKVDKKGVVKSASKVCGKKKTDILKTLKKNWKC